MKRYLCFLIFPGLIAGSCSVQRKISATAQSIVLEDSSLRTAHVGISIFDPAKNKYLYNFQGDKYFIPASNTKIPTCYASLKYLGDSLLGLKYLDNGSSITIFPNGDPTFLLPEFPKQPMLEFLKQNKKPVTISTWGWQENALGSGWSWNDYQETYMAERSIMPAYGNVVQFTGTTEKLTVIPKVIIDGIVIDTTNGSRYIRSIVREKNGNAFRIYAGGSSPARVSRTFDTKDGDIITSILEDTLHRQFNINNSSRIHFTSPGLIPVYTQHTDSVLKPMMHRSDNFFAEQALLMVSNKVMGYMDDSKIIDSIINTDFRDLPQKPRWVDGSGLSRYNLFTPMSMVGILKKIHSEFGMDKIKLVFPTGGEGTISNYYKEESGFIYGKTGTLSGVVAFSGYLLTKNGRLLIFSTFINNHQANSTDIRKAIEKFLVKLRSL